ncbi:MAG: hypothetical protein JWQ54_912 [Mucilaginibacter sp.]|nr:hypothetical protein [Mucilaginibacter sp.]
MKYKIWLELEYSVVNKIKSFEIDNNQNLILNIYWGVIGYLITIKP